MSRYATSDPILTSSASDKRKAPSLIPPPAAKKKRTSKEVTIQVRMPCPSDYNATPLSDHLFFCMISD
jgi:hypothetical protein